MEDGRMGGQAGPRAQGGKEEQHADAAAKRVNARMINEERWIDRSPLAHRKTNAYRPRLLITRFALKR